MPMAPPKHCPRGHPAYTGPRCPVCADAWRREADLKRPNARARGYDNDWRRFRAAFLKVNPVCCIPGCGQPATDVDHIKSLREGGRRLDPNNCRPMCHPHHSARTMRDQVPRGGRG